MTEPTVLTCARCSEPIDASSWYPVAMAPPTDDSHPNGVVPFCSEACRERWLDEQRPVSE